jgi:hypothetical protein
MTNTIKEITENCLHDLEQNAVPGMGVTIVDKYILESHSLGKSEGAKDTLSILEGLKTACENYLENAEEYFMSKDGIQAALSLIQTQIENLK